MTLTLSSARDLLARMNACDESSRWLAVLPSDTTPESAWSTCPRGDWLVWLLGRLHRAGVLSRQTLTLAGCAAARTSLVHLAGTPWHAPSLAAIETTERWCRGEATPEDVRKAQHAAWEARDAAAYAAAYDAADAAAAAAAADDAYAAAAYAADAADAAAARAKRRQEIADAVRAVVPWSLVERALGEVSP